MKIVVLSTRLSGYMSSCLETFKQQENAELLLYIWPNQLDAPFNVNEFEALGRLHNRFDFTDDKILSSVLSFEPDAVLVSGWKDKGYVGICRQLKAKGIAIISGCDTQWDGSVRQLIASTVAPVHVQKFIDVLWVTGERQRYLANALGFKGERCWDGYYACDWDAFSVQGNCALKPEETAYFLYVGRYAPEKGLDTLAAAYQAYCRQAQNPWPLVCAGAGSLGDMLVAAGAEDRGFVQPKNLPALMQNAAAFVLPSRFEPWGVVIQEAAASGLPLILSDDCGASAHLLRPYYNGFSFSSGNIEDLTQALKAMHHLTSQQRLEYGLASYSLSKQYTPRRWATTLLHGLQRLQPAHIKTKQSQLTH